VFVPGLVEVGVLVLLAEGLLGLLVPLVVQAPRRIRLKGTTNNMDLCFIER
jgi:hypothetical protein